MASRDIQCESVMEWMSLRQERRKKRYNLCGVDGHTYKKCPKMQEDNAGAEVGPSGNPTDGLPPDFGARRV